MAKKNMNKTDCGDWHLGWGYGGLNKVGNLTMITPPDKKGMASFEWKGRSQGRHGQKFNYGAFLKFTSDGEKIVKGEQEGSAPVQSEILKAVSVLLDRLIAD